ncbi:MAG: hypothetical protein Q8K83_02570 [Methylotenera sp.]|nr:hypothetical protein [Methylotenera sp.]
MTSANTYPIYPKDALLELTLLNAEQIDDNFDDLLIDSLKRNIPPEIVTRLLITMQNLPGNRVNQH